MKKLNFTLTFLLTLSALVAQPELSNYGFFEDFSTTEEYVADDTSGRGLFWRGDNRRKVTRNGIDKRLDVVVSQNEYEYTPFGVNFGDDNGDLSGGVPNTIDLTNNGTWSFDITNNDTLAFMVRVSCQDIKDKLIDCSPTPAGLVFDNIWKYQTQITVPVGKTVTFKAGTPNDAGAGLKNNCDFNNGVWGDYGDPGVYPHVNFGIRTDCDRSKIKGINITVLNAAKNSKDFHNLPLVNGKLSLSNFRVGESSASYTPNAVVDELLDEQVFTFSPNPAKTLITFTHKLVTNVTSPLEILNSNGKVVYSNQMATHETMIDISFLQEGFYLVKYAQKAQKLMVEK